MQSTRILATATNRFGIVAVGVMAISLVSVTVVVSAFSIGILVVGGLLAVVSIYVGARAPWLGVTLTDSALEIHGLFRSRIIEKSSIVEIRDNASVEWSDAAGIIHASPVTAFLALADSPGSRGQLAAAQRMRDWLEE